MKKIQDTVYWTIIVSEASHIFCCVLPTVFSLLSLLAGIGMIGSVPLWLEDLHNVLHGWELPMIAVSGVLLSIGWGLFYYSRKIDCHDTGCEHGPCAPKKNMSNRVLQIATALFLINVFVFLVFHRGMGIGLPEEPAHHSHADAHTAHDHHHGHDH